MSSPILRSPLYGFNLERQARVPDSSAGVWANEITSAGFISLRGSSKDSKFVTAATEALKVALPIEPCTFAVIGRTRVLWISPDEWLIVARREEVSSVIADLCASLDGAQCQVVDNSGGYAEIMLLGQNAADVLRHVSVYDPAALGRGRVVGTTLAKASCHLSRAGEGFSLVVRRSFAEYIWLSLVKASGPYGIEIARFHSEQGGALR